MFGLKEPETLKSDNTQDIGYEWGEILDIAFSYLQLTQQEFWEMTWLVFWKRYDGFMREKAYLYSILSNPHTEKPRTFNQLYSDTFNAISMGNQSTSSLASFAFKAKQMGLELPDSLKK